MKDEMIKVELTEDKLNISIGVDYLVHICGEGRAYGLGEVTVTDREKFLPELVNELKSEAEDGSTLVHHLVDQAVTEALEAGASGIEYDEE